MRVGVSLLILLLAGGALTPLAMTKPGACEGYADVPGQGPSCPTEGGWEVILRDGSRVSTHGPDALPTASDAKWGYVSADPDMPRCVDSATDEHRGVLVYAVPGDRTSLHAQRAGTLRDMMANINGLLVRESTAMGRPMEYRMRCTGGTLDVAEAILPTPAAQATFATIVSDLLELGFDAQHEKYWVYYQDGDIQFRCACGGQGTLIQDGAASPHNANNFGPSFGLTYGDFGVGSWGEMTLMHENAHNLGAVQNTAPKTSGAGHCNDGLDIMCYDDGGPQSAYKTSVCGGYRRFDCGGDTYFHSKPAPGSYLTWSWNLASPYGRWLEGCHRVEATLAFAPAAPQGGATPSLASAVVDVPAACAGHSFGLAGVTRQVPAGAVGLSATLRRAPVQDDYDICWYGAAGLLSCVTAGEAPLGTVPAGALTAKVLLVRGAPEVDARFVLHIV